MEKTGVIVGSRVASPGTDRAACLAMLAAYWRSMVHQDCAASQKHGVEGQANHFLIAAVDLWLALQGLGSWHTP